MSLLLLLRPRGVAGPPQPPSIVSFTPPSGPIGTVVVLTGSSFTGTTDVSFNGIPALIFNVDADSQITVTVPFGATDGLISVTTAIGTGFSATPFDVTVPVVTASAGIAKAPPRKIRIRYADIKNRKATAEFLKEHLRKHQVEIPEPVQQANVKVEKLLAQDLIEVQALDGDEKKQKIIQINNAIITLLLLSYDA